MFDNPDTTSYKISWEVSPIHCPKCPKTWCVCWLICASVKHLYAISVKHMNLYVIKNETSIISKCLIIKQTDISYPPIGFKVSEVSGPKYLWSEIALI